MKSEKAVPADAVLDMLVDLTNRDPDEIQHEDRLLTMLTGDDFTILVLSVEKALGVKTDPKVWEHVSTVGQTIKVFEDAARQQELR